VDGPKLCPAVKDYGVANIETHDRTRRWVILENTTSISGEIRSRKMPKPEPAFSEDAKSIETKSSLGSKESARFFGIVYELRIERYVSCEVVQETCTGACWGLVDFVQVRAGHNSTDFEGENSHKKPQNTQKFL